MSNTSAPSCVLCGCTYSHPNASLVSIAPRFLQSTTREDDIRYINEEVNLLDRQIELLRTKRASLLNRLNEIQSYTCAVPPEILSYVMEVVAANMTPINEDDWLTRLPPKRIFTFFPLILSAVSSHWRQVARSTPRIWTSLRLELDTYFSQPVWENSMIGLLNYYFERAKNHPLSLALGCTLFRTIDEESFKSVFEIVLRGNATRIKELYLYNPTSMLLEMAHGDGNTFPQLRVLELVSKVELLDDEIASFTLPNVPALESLSLHNMTTPTDLSLTKITHLQLDDVPRDDCIRLLLECRETLVKFICTYPGPPQFANWLGNDRTYTVPHLETFEWGFANEINFDDIVSWDKFILECLDLSSLRDLTLRKVSPYVIRDMKQPFFFKDSPSTLSSVDISTASDPFGDVFEEKDLGRLLDFNTSKLSIGSSSVDILCTLQTLTPSRHPKRKVLIPNLKILYIHGNIPTIGWIPDDDPLNSDGESDFYSPQVSGDVMCSTLFHMLEERLPSHNEETTETLQEPFVLVLPYVSMACEAYMNYREKLETFISAGVLQLKVVNYI